MLKSSAQSLHDVFTSFDALAAEGWSDTSKIASISHNLKGVLMNMGEMEWAEKVMQIEQSAQQKKVATDYASFFNQLRKVYAPLVGVE